MIGVYDWCLLGGLCIVVGWWIGVDCGLWIVWCVVGCGVGCVVGCGVCGVWCEYLGSRSVGASAIPINICGYVIVSPTTNLIYPIFTSSFMQSPTSRINIFKL
jgi:hypothetical protein